MLTMLGRLLRKHLRAHRRDLVLVVIFQAIQSAATLWLPSLNAQIIDKGVVLGDTGYIWTRGAVMLAVSLVQVGFAVAAIYFGSRAAMGFGRDVRHDLFHTVNSFSTYEVGEFGAPSLITRITNDVQQVQMLVQMSATMLVAAPMMVVGGVIMALREDVQLSGLLVVAVPIMLVAVGVVLWRMVPAFQMMQIRIDKVNEVLREQITGIRVIRAFIREPEEHNRFASANDDLTVTSLRAGRLMALLFPSVILVLNVSSAAAIWIGGDRIAAQEMQIGALIAFLSYLIQILMALLMATFMAVLLPRAAVCADRIQAVLETEPSVHEPVSAVSGGVSSGHIEMRDVGFCYPGAAEPVLCNISFGVGPGETLAIVGGTGAGKTTLLNLVPRLFDVTDGQVLVDGVDVREMDMQTLWRGVGLVPQKPYLFSGTVATNLRFGNPHASDEELWEALRVAQAADFVEAMPQSIDSPIEQGGTNVSGGQRQRLAIARALVRKPRIYLFDDSFSALDLATDARLRTALEPYTTDAVKVIVAQRVSTILHADQILVLDDGRIVGIGTHESLLVSCPTYAEIVASQLSASDAA